MHPVSVDLVKNGRRKMEDTHVVNHLNNIFSLQVFVIIILWYVCVLCLLTISSIGCFAYELLHRLWRSRQYWCGIAAARHDGLYSIACPTWWSFERVLINRIWLFKWWCTNNGHENEVITNVFTSKQAEFLMYCFNSHLQRLKGGIAAVVCLIRYKLLPTVWLWDSQAVIVRDGIVPQL